MKIVILGGGGYVGFELCELFKNSNDEILCIDNNFLSWQPSYFRKNNIKFYHRDIFNCADLIKDADVLYNLVSITLVPQVQSQETPEKSAEIYRIGTEGNRYILNNINKDCKIVFPSTHVIWEGLTEQLEVSEDDVPCPFLSYGKSKYQSEQDIKNSGNPYIIARLASVYGYNQVCRWRILPNLFSKMVADNQNLKVFGSQNLKPICGINDVARALKMFDDNKYTNKIFNIVNECYTVMDIAKICQKYNPKISIIETHDETPNKGYKVSNKKLLSTGFEFKQNLEKEIEKMIEYWKNE